MENIPTLILKTDINFAHDLFWANLWFFCSLINTRLLDNVEKHKAFHTKSWLGFLSFSMSNRTLGLYWEHELCFSFGSSSSYSSFYSRESIIPVIPCQNMASHRAGSPDPVLEGHYPTQDFSLTRWPTLSPGIPSVGQKTWLDDGPWGLGLNTLIYKHAL